MFMRHKNQRWRKPALRPFLYYVYIIKGNISVLPSIRDCAVFSSDPYTNDASSHVVIELSCWRTPGLSLSWSDLINGKHVWTPPNTGSSCSIVMAKHSFWTSHSLHSTGMGANEVKSVSDIVFIFKNLRSRCLTKGKHEQTCWRTANKSLSLVFWKWDATRIHFFLGSTGLHCFSQKLSSGKASNCYMTGWENQQITFLGVLTNNICSWKTSYWKTSKQTALFSPVTLIWHGSRCPH